MAIRISSGEVSFADINVELGTANETNRSLNDSSARSLAGVASGTISLSDFRNKYSTTSLLFTAGFTTYPEAYVWSGSGFGTKYSAPTGSGGSQYTIFKRGNHAFVGRVTSAVSVSAWAFFSGWGALSAAPQSVGVASQAITTNSAGNWVVAGDNDGNVLAWRWSAGNGYNGGGWVGSAANSGGPFVASGGVPNDANDIYFSRNGNAVIIAHNNSPFVTAFAWTNSSGFGTKYSNPSTLPSTTGYGLGVTSSAVIVASKSSSSVGVKASPQAWGWTDSSGFGTKYSDSSSGFERAFFQGLDVAFDETKVIGATFADSTTYFLPCVHFWSWSNSSGWGTYNSSPSGAPTANGARGCSINSSSNAAAFATTQSPTVRVWAISSSGFGTKFSDPGTATGSSRYDVFFA